LQRHLQVYNDKFSNVKATLGHSLLAFETYMHWYPLYEQVERILGRRLAIIFAYSISLQANCIVCIAYFRKILLEAGENPDELVLSPQQKEVFDWGAAIARYNGNISDHLYDRVAERHGPNEMVILIAFAGQMIAMNIFNNVAETEPDEYLQPYLPYRPFGVEE
jgi:hypothetical protein